MPSFEDFAYASSNQPEADDELHDPGPKLKVVGPDHRLIEPRSYRRSQGLLGISWNGLLNLAAIASRTRPLVCLWWPASLLLDHRAQDARE